MIDRSVPPGTSSEAPAAEGKERANFAYSIEKLDRMKRVMFTEDDEREIERFVAQLAESLGTKLKFSHVMRACALILRHAEAPILNYSSSVPQLRRPPNGNPDALAHFEERLASILHNALKASMPMD